MLLAPRTLRANVSWTILSNVFFGVYQWAILAVLAQLSGAVAVGDFSLALGLVVPVQMFFSLQLRGLQASDSSGDFPFSTYLVVRIVGIIATVVVVLAMVGLGFVRPSLLAPVAGVLVVKSVESLSDIVYGYLQRFERLDLVSKSRILESTVGLLLFTFVFAFTDSIALAMIAVAGGLLLILLGYTWRVLLKTVPIEQMNLSWADQKTGAFRIGLLGLPLGITMALVHFNAALPRFFLDSFATTAEVGIFAGVLQIVTSGAILTGAIGQSFTPRLAQLIESREMPIFMRLVRRLVTIGIVLGILGAGMSALVGEPIVSRLYSPEFGDSVDTLVILSIGASFTFAASFLGFALTSARILNAQVMVIVATVVTNVIALVILVPRFGIDGAAWSSVASAAVQFGLSWWYLHARGKEISVH